MEALALMGGLLVAIGVVIRLIPTKYHRQDERVIAYNRTLDPLLAAMIVVGLALIAAYGATLVL